MKFFALSIFSLVVLSVVASSSEVSNAPGSAKSKFKALAKTAARSSTAATNTANTAVVTDSQTIPAPVATEAPVDNRWAITKTLMSALSAFQGKPEPVPAYELSSQKNQQDVPSVRKILNELVKKLLAEKEESKRTEIKAEIAAALKPIDGIVHVLVNNEDVRISGIDEEDEEEDDDQDGDDSQKPGSIWTTVAIGGGALTVLLAALVFFLRRNKKSAQNF